MKLRFFHNSVMMEYLHCIIMLHVWGMSLPREIQDPKVRESDPKVRESELE